jgi:hypothetical protein
MKRLGGPELKLPERFKAPPFLVDLYWDLRDRHLLPLVALALVACVAAPILLGGSSQSEAPPPASASPIEAPEGGGRTLAVAQAEPGLREPSKRLRGRRAHDPFRQRLAGGAREGSTSDVGGPGTAVLGEGAEGATTIATTTSQPNPESTAEAGGGSSPSGGSAGGAETGSAGNPPVANPVQQDPSGSGGGNGAGSGQGHGKGSEEGSGSSEPEQIQLFTFAIDVRITKTTTEADGTKSKSEVIEKERVLPSSALPYKKSQVVTYMGISPKTQQPLLLVSEAVSSVFGEAKCVAGEGRCQLVELEKGFPVTFVYGENDVRYKIVVLKIEPVSVGHS